MTELRRSYYGFLFSVAVTLSATVAGCGSAGDGLVKHQVRGAVQLNGHPQKGIVVNFNHTDKNQKGNAAQPVAITDDDGTFTLSTNGEGDGAVAGEYIVTFFWPSGGASPTDLLKGQYTNPATSQSRVTITEGEHELKPFKLQIHPEIVAAGRKLFAKEPTSN